MKEQKKKYMKIRKPGLLDSPLSTRRDSSSVDELLPFLLADFFLLLAGGGTVSTWTDGGERGGDGARPLTFLRPDAGVTLIACCTGDAWLTSVILTFSGCVTSDVLGGTSGGACAARGGGGGVCVAKSDVTTGLSELERAWDFFLILSTKRTRNQVDAQRHTSNVKRTTMRAHDQPLRMGHLFASFEEDLFFFLPLSVA